LIAPLGPFEPNPCMAIAVSGGADSLASALLVRDWTSGQGGACLALIVDHRLRAESADEARLTADRLARLGIASDILTLTDLAHGPGLAERARAARHDALEDACAQRGILHLVFGHHAGDQAETICMRLLAGSGAAGLAGMSPLSETARLRRLRPLLAIPPARLRATLLAAGMDWVEDPSNRNPAAQRARLRGLRADPAGDGLATRALVLASRARGAARAAREAEIAEELGEKAAIYPQGFAHLLPGKLSPAALAALIGMIGGASRPVAEERLRPLSENLAPATIAGVRIVPAGRFGEGFLLVRELAAIAPAKPAHRGMVWDGRFRLNAAPPPGCETSAWGKDARNDREFLPMIVASGLPVLRCGGSVLTNDPAMMHEFVFAPPRPAASAPFFPLPVGA
jgi:tRNA(Ile)-lysidine synthase